MAIGILYTMIPAISLPITIPVIPQIHRHKMPINSTLKSLSKSPKLDETLNSIQPLHTKTNPTKADIDAYSSFLHTCISEKSIEHGQKLYLQLLLSRAKGYNNVLSSPRLKFKFITLYSVCGRLDEARRILEDKGEVPESVWVAMALGYMTNGYSNKALLLYVNMLSNHVPPGNFAFSTVLKACETLSYLRVGRGIHGQIVKSMEEADQRVYNALLGLYVECGSVKEVLKVFAEMPERDVDSWNSLIAGFVKRDQLFVSLEIFRRMQRGRVGFSWVTLTTMLTICARLTALNSGKEIHGQILKSVEKPDVLVLNSLLDMYTKCGAMVDCRRVFDNMQDKDLTTWNTLLRGYAINGNMERPTEVLDEIVEAGFCPDGITFTALLSVYSSAGLTELGQDLFERMEVEFNVSPTVEHYACLVDLLGRAGKINEALKIVNDMPMKPTGSIWGSLLNSCRLYGNVSLAEKIAKQLFLIEPDNPSNYVMLSNIYANAELWEGVKNVREMMEKKTIRKYPGCSWMQIKNKIYTFVANGSSEFRNSDKYKSVWDELIKAMEEVGYIPDNRTVLHDVNEKMKMEWVCGHSERLATMYGLINVGPSMPIRVTKNLRVCGDCHSWMKIVSKVMRRLIILRDITRFHHFENGSCSCNDYW